MSNLNWKAYVHRIKPFNGDLIPVFEDGKRIGGAVKNHNFTVEDILMYKNLKAIELRTSIELMCIDFDSEDAFLFAQQNGFNWADNFTWFVQRDNHISRLKLFFFRTKEQQNLIGEFYLNINEHDLEIFSISSKAVTIIGEHRTSGNYRWYGSGPEDIKYCPSNLWNFVESLHKKNQEEIKPRKNTSDWNPIKPCPICGRIKDNDCKINRSNDFIKCHHGKTNHPPSLKKGEIINKGSIDWAFCGFSSNAIGIYSKFKIHKISPLSVLAKKVGVI